MEQQEESLKPVHENSAVLFYKETDNYNNKIKLVITKGYGVRATTIEGQNAFSPALCFAYA